MKTMNFYVLLFLTGLVHSHVTESLDKCVILFKEIPGDNDFKELQKFDLTLLHKITPRTCTFKYTNDDTSLTETLAVVKSKFRDKIAELEKVKEYVDFIETNPTTTPFSGQYPEDESNPEIENVEKYLDFNEQNSEDESTNLVCDKYYGMGIEDAWAKGYTGKGVVIAVTDVGINTDLKDLKPNINETLSFNLMHNIKDVTPEYFHSYREVFSTTDHGNRCASLIAAVKGNNICSAGIAYNATIAAVKMSKVTFNHFHTFSTSDTRARSQVHEMDSIDIYSNSWALSEEFDTLDVAMREALETSAEDGRQGRGAIHVFPAGPYVNDLANNEYIITVSAVGQNGSTPTKALISSSVLTSGLHDGNTLTAKSMVTTSYGKQCVRKFAGVSAATAQIAGIIALALEANPDLTRADVEDLIVHSSESTCLVEAENFIMNAAGLRFHIVFGFGILNASVFVKNAASRKIRVGTSSHTLQATNYSADEENAYIAKFYYNCLSGECFNNVTKAKIQLRYTTSSDKLRMTLISPGGTVSVLQDLKSDRIETKGSPREQILTSVHFWDEEAFGLWTFKLRSNGVSVVNVISLTLFGVNSHDRNGYNAKKNETTPTDISNETSRSRNILVAVLVSCTIIIFVPGLLVYQKCRKRSRLDYSSVPYVSNRATINIQQCALTRNYECSLTNQNENEIQNSLQG